MWIISQGLSSVMCMTVFMFLNSSPQVHAFLVVPRILSSVSSSSWLSHGSSITMTRTLTTPTWLQQSPYPAVVDEYCRNVQTSIDNQDFVSLTLKGPTKKTGTKDELRGCLSQVQGRLVETPKQKIVFQITLKYHGATDIAKNWNRNEVGHVLKVLLEDSDVASQLYKSEWGTWHESGTKFGLSTGVLTTLSSVTELNLRTGAVKRKAATRVGTTAGTTRVNTTDTTVVSSHNRIKQVPISSEAPFWDALGLSKMTAKRKQCQKFVEIVSSLIKKKISDKKKTGVIDTLQTVDMGCGRGYLTFSLHHYLRETYHDSIDVHTRGIDMRPKLVAEMNQIVASLNSTTMNGLVFETGAIEQFLESSTTTATTNHNSPTALSILIALHACDTATDDALWSGIESQADIIVVAPCCHKQVRPQLDGAAASMQKDHPLADILRHAIYRERLSETVTDSMRAMLLEMANYQVQVFEFIGGEHTAKNVMITAVKRLRRRSAAEQENLQERLQSLAALHGVHTQTLATWMKQDLGIIQQGTRSTNRLSTKAMPPL